MTWAKVDDKLHAHPKARQAGPAAMGLWVMALSYCTAYLTDGFVAEHELDRFVSPEDGRFARARLLARADSLVRAALWERVSGGWRFHDWCEYQPSREKVLAEKKANSERQSRWKERVTNSVGNALATPLVTLPRPVPSRPVPSRPKEEEEENKEIPILVTAEAEPALFPAEVIQPTGPSAREVFDQFQAIRSKHLPKTKRQVFSPDRQRKIEQALASHGADDVIAALHGYFLDPWHESIQFAKADVEYVLRNARHIERFRDHQLRHARVSAKPSQSVAAKVQPSAAEQAEVMAKLEGWAREAGAASFEEYASGAMAAVSSRLQGADDADPFDVAFDVFMGPPGAAAT